MAKPWDEAMKRVVAASPQAFIDWLFPGGQFIELVTTELLKQAEEPLRSDNCLVMELEGKSCIVHLEIQSTADSEMPERLLEYGLRIIRNDPQRRPVYSCVIYVRKVNNVPQLPLVWEYPNGLENLRYHYGSIELAELEPEVILETHQLGLLPLLPLTKGGANRTVAETMFSGLQSAGRTDLIPIGTLLASLAFGNENTAEQSWLTRKVSEMYDILQETPVYQFMTKEAIQEMSPLSLFPPRGRGPNTSPHLTPLACCATIRCDEVYKRHQVLGTIAHVRREVKGIPPWEHSPFSFW